MKDEALRLALEALEQIKQETFHPAKVFAHNHAITSIKQALTQPEPEPVAWANRVIGGKKWLSIHASKGASDKWLEYRRKEQAQGEQYEQIAFYTTPPHRKPLTDEEIRLQWSEFWETECHPWAIEFARAIEAAHGIKGEA